MWVHVRKECSVSPFRLIPPPKHLFFLVGPRGVFLESQLEGSQWSMQAEVLPVPVSSSLGSPGPSTHTATKAEQAVKRQRCWGNTQWHNGKCCTGCGAFPYKHKEEWQGCGKVCKCLNHPWWDWWRASHPNGNLASSGNNLREFGIIPSLKFGGI